MGKYRGNYKKKLVKDGFVRNYKVPDDPKFFQTAEFRRLHDKWHKKLESSGFYDCEEFDSPLQLMKAYESERFRVMYTGDEFLSQQRYYELATQLLHDHTFRDMKDQRIWQMHCEGENIKDTAEKLKLKREYVTKFLRETRKKIVRQTDDDK